MDEGGQAMKQLRYPIRLLALLALLLVSAWGCRNGVEPTERSAGETDFDEGDFWDVFPLPDDAETLPFGEGFDLGFSTRMVEPEVFDFYAAWLSEQGWQQQAPTEAMVTLPHQTWRKDGVELLIEIEGVDAGGHTVVWVRTKEL